MHLRSLLAPLSRHAFSGHLTGQNGTPFALGPLDTLGGAAALARRLRWRSAEGGKKYFGTGDNTNLTPEDASASSVLST